MSLQDIKIGCIGAGNMGGAIISGLSQSIPPHQMTIFDIEPIRTETLAKKFKINSVTTLKKLVEFSNIIIIAVKPDTVSTVLNVIKNDLKDEALISIAAGVSISDISSIVGSDKEIIRAMPNTPALIGRGMTVISCNDSCSDKTRNIALNIFSEVSEVLELKEKLMDAVTGTSGSGPAYVFTFIQAMTDGAVKMGIPRKEAQLLAAKTVEGAARMVLDTREDPISLRGKVTSPGGTTIDAVHVLEQRGFSGIVMDAVETATLKSKSLGEKK
jgi:pyrroline-5-carboxylate reductase